MVWLETQTDELDGDAGSWYTGNSQCDVQDQQLVATRVQVDMTIQYYQSGVGWGNCHYTKSAASNTGSVSLGRPANIFNNCIKPGTTITPYPNQLFATNALHIVRIRGTDRSTNQAVTERSP